MELKEVALWPVIVRKEREIYMRENLEINAVIPLNVAERLRLAWIGYRKDGKSSSSSIEAEYSLELANADA